MIKRKQQKFWQMFCLLALLALSLQSCLGIGGSSNTKKGDFQSKHTNGGNSLGVNSAAQALFKGSIYFTYDRNLYVLNGNKNLTQLTQGMDVRDPAVSPDGKWVAFIKRYPDYSDLMLLPTAGGKPRLLRTGVGQYIPNPNSPMGAPQSTAIWYAQPSWQDATHLIFLSDLAKFYTNPGVDSFLLDLQVFEISIDDPTAVPQTLAYANYGAGGDRDASYRPGHPDQIIYTHYAYDSTGANQLTQIYLEDPNAIVNHPGKYRPGATGFAFDPGIAITPPEQANLQPSFSPDGSTIAYIRRIDDSHMGLYLMPVPAENVTQDPNNPVIIKQALEPYNQSVLIQEGLYISQPFWSPDGTQLGYLSYNNDVFDIWLMHMARNPKTNLLAAKDTPIQLTDTGGHLDGDSRPSWSQ
jgi:WD40-like Beta Propeller Repeat